MANTMVLRKTARDGESRPTARLVGGERDPLGLDLYEGLLAWRLWTMLGWEDIRQRYRRSVLGPFWITLSMGTLIALLGVIYSRIFKMDIQHYLPYFAVGYIMWGFISTCITESCSAFQEGERIIKQVKWPFSVYVLRVVWRNFIIFLHTIVIFVPIAIFFGLKPQLINLLALPGFLLLYANQVWLGLTLAILSARFRDVVQIVTTVVTIMLFATPIMYPVSTLGDMVLIAEVNPVYHFIDLVRAPMLGQQPALLSWAVAIATVAVGSVCAMLLFRRVSRRIVYWL
jgi:ABC-type polysaccharide/polyol phosphate export permease